MALASRWEASISLGLTSLKSPRTSLIGLQPMRLSWSSRLAQGNEVRSVRNSRGSVSWKLQSHVYFLLQPLGATSSCNRLLLAITWCCTVAPNNSFKPNLLRSTKAMAEKACHGFGSTTQVGLTQALGPM